MADITLFDIQNSTDYNRIQLYKEHLTVPEDAYSKGCYYERGNWYKDFYIYANSQTITVKVLMAIEVDPSGGYTLSTRALMMQSPNSETVQRIAQGFSMAIDENNIDPVVDSFKNYVRDKLNTGDTETVDLLEHMTDSTGNVITSDYFIDKPNSLLDTHFEEYIDFANIKAFDSSIINYLYDFFLHEFGDIGNYYKYGKVDRDNGAYILENWDNEQVKYALSGSVKDGSISIASLNSDDVFTLMTNILNTEDVAAIKTKPIMRIGYRFITPSVFYIKVSGFDILNNQLNVENDGALMYATVTNAESVTFKYESGTITKYSDATRTNNVSCTFTNTIRSIPLDASGRDGGTDGKEIYENVIDSIGFTGNIAPYTVLQNDYPIPSQTPKERYPSWVGDDTTPVGDPTPDPCPNPIRIGRPDPKKRIRPYNTKEPTPPPDDEKSNVETSEDDPPSTKGVLGSMYDLGTDDLLLNQLAAFLYDPLNAERIAQFWKNDPTQSIVSLHYLYVDPDTSGNPSIALGNVNTNINAPEIVSRYKTFDCGERAVERKFNTAMDYNTKISLYLPFSGIHPLNTEEVMNSKIKVKGSVDVITGDILYQITVNRKQPDGTYMTDNKCLYTFTGNCKVDIPYSSSSFNKGGVGGILGNVLTGNLKGAFTGVIGTATGGFSDVTASGNLSGNSGAMGYKYPYLIIEYPKVLDIAERGKLFGHAANKTVRLSQVSGYAEFDRVHIDTVSCTDTERNMIENALKTGVII